LPPRVTTPSGGKQPQKKLAATVANGVFATNDDEGAEVMSADDFMKRITGHVQHADSGGGHAAAPHRGQLRRAQVQIRAAAATAAAMRKKLGKLDAHNAVVQRSVHKARSNQMLRLGESMSNEGELSVDKLSPPEQARLNLLAAEAFPGDEARLVSLKRKQAGAMRQIRKLHARHTKVQKELSHHQARMHGMESESEYQLMTNPDFEAADSEAQDKLQGLRAAERKLAGRLRDARHHKTTLARQVLREQKLHAVTEKAVLLMTRFKRNSSLKLESERKQFEAKALKAAAKKAKAQYKQYMSQGRHKLQLDTESSVERKRLRHLAQLKRKAARESAREARKSERLKRRRLRRKERALALARRVAEEESQVKMQAEAMFTEYKTRYIRIIIYAKAKSVRSNAAAERSQNG